jgi:hypothetical protein
MMFRDDNDCFLDALITLLLVVGCVIVLAAIGAMLT